VSTWPCHNDLRFFLDALRASRMPTIPFRELCLKQLGIPHMKDLASSTDANSSNYAIVLQLRKNTALQ